MWHTNSPMDLTATVDFVLLYGVTIIQNVKFSLHITAKFECLDNLDIIT
jgi:hypothetical protein